MLEVSAQTIIFAAAHLERIQALYDEWKDSSTAPNLDSPLPMKLRMNVARTYENILRSSDALNIPVTKAAAGRAAKKLRAKSTSISFRDIQMMNSEIRSRLDDELEFTRFYCMSKSASNFYNPDQPLFGHSVEQNIPNASNDISESGKCFAVARYTASAFHLMRAMESAVQVLSAALGIPNVEREWGKLLSDVSLKIEGMEKGATRDAWSAVHSNLYHVKQAWRNSTMHPKKTYTEEECRDLFNAMKSFMKQLAGIIVLPNNLAPIPSD